MASKPGQGQFCFVLTSRDKNSTNHGLDQHYNVQAAVEQVSLLTVALSLSRHPVDKAEALSTIAAIPTPVAQPEAVAVDRNYFSPTTIKTLQAQGIEPYMATGREPHQRGWRDFFAQTPASQPAEAGLIVKMAYKLQSDIGRAVYRLHKCPVEPAIGIIEEVSAFASSRCGA